MSTLITLLLAYFSLLWLGVLTLFIMQPVLAKPLLLRATVFAATAFTILLVLSLPFASWTLIYTEFFVSMFPMSFIGAGLGFLFHRQRLPSPEIAALLGGVFTVLTILAVPVWLGLELLGIITWPLVGSALVALVGGFFMER